MNLVGTAVTIIYTDATKSVVVTAGAPKSVLNTVRANLCQPATERPSFLALSDVETGSMTFFNLDQIAEVHVEASVLVETGEDTPRGPALRS